MFTLAYIESARKIFSMSDIFRVITFLENGIKHEIQLVHLFLTYAFKKIFPFLDSLISDLNSSLFLQVLQTKTLSQRDCSRLLRLLACTHQLTLESMTARVALIVLHRSPNQPTLTPNPTSVTEVSTLWQSYDRSCLSSRYE